MSECGAGPTYLSEEQYYHSRARSGGLNNDVLNFSIKSSLHTLKSALNEVRSESVGLRNRYSHVMMGFLSSASEWTFQNRQLDISSTEFVNKTRCSNWDRVVTSNWPVVECWPMGERYRTNDTWRTAADFIIFFIMNTNTRTSSTVAHWANSTFTSSVSQHFAVRLQLSQSWHHGRLC